MREVKADLFPSVCVNLDPFVSTKIKALTDNDLDLAIELVKNNEESIHSAAPKYKTVSSIIC